MKKIVIYIIGISVFLFNFVILGGMWFTSAYINEEIENIARVSLKENAAQPGAPDSLLPAPVQKYLGYALGGEQNSLAMAAAKFKARIKTTEDGEWKNISGTTFYSLTEPGFLWVAELEMSEFLDAQVVERYIDGKGADLVKILSSLTINDTKGEFLDQSYLVRYYSEALLFPSVLRGNENTSWGIIDSLASELQVKYGDSTLSMIYYFNEEGSVDRIETKDRLRTTNAGYMEELSTIRFDKYKSIGGRKIPSYFEMEWNSGYNEFLFAKYELEDIIYFDEVPEPSKLEDYLD